VAGREPRAPAALFEHVNAALGELPNDVTCADARDQVAAECLRAAERVLARVLAAGSTTRDTALDLLTADALVTYAFEAASEAPERVPALAREAMARLSRLAAEPVPS
jgi:hypothetical protein